MGPGGDGKSLELKISVCYVRVKIDVMSCSHWLELGEVFSGGRGGSY